MILKSTPLRRWLPVFVSGALLLLLAVSAIWGSWQLVSYQMAFACLAVTALILLLRHRLTQPLTYLQQSVSRISRGDLDTKIVISGGGELAEFAADLDRMRVAFGIASKERARTLTVLREREQNLAITLQSIGDGVIATTAAGLITSMNTAAERLTGWSFTDAAGRPLAEVFHTIDARTRASAINPVQKVIATGAAVSLSNHTALLSRDGHELQIFESAAPIRDGDGQLFGVVLVFKDVTEDYRVRQALANTTALLERTSEMAKVGGWECNLKTMQVTWSGETYHIYELDPAVELTLTSAMSFYGADAQSMYQAVVQTAIDSGGNTPWYLELPITTGQGRKKWVRFLGTVVREGNEPIGLRGTIQDVTEYMEAEAELRIAATAFESQEGLFVTDANNKILKVNHAFTTITGYTGTEVLGRDPELFGSGRHDAIFYAAMWKSINNSGVWRGEIWNRRKNGQIYPQWLTISSVKDRAGITTHYVGAFTDITDRIEAERKIESLAFYDPLTGLPNRRLLLDRLGHVLASTFRHRRLGALLFIDLDNFKVLNDTHGHDKGDQLLQQVAQRLTANIRESDTVGRLGGDEFVVLLENIGHDTLKAAAEAELVGEKILATLGQPYMLGDLSHRSTPSVGITLLGDSQEAIEEPLKRADLAMYQAKAAGRNTLRFFDPQIQTAIAARSQLEIDLRAAVADNQFLLLYQPQIVGETTLTGAEALVRWRHPQRGMVSPAEFIPLAEETGLILSLGRWVLDTACIQLALWATQADKAHLTIAVNVSPRQFHQIDFVDQVLAAITSAGANPKLLKLELTEGILVSNMEDVITKMTLLKQNEVGFSLDDFGTGYSSLAYLKRLPLDQLKIDQGFVRDILIDPNDAAIAKTIIALADSLGLQVIAEGVETEQQRRFLAELGCPAYQGYLFSRPLPIGEFEQYARRL